MFGPEYLKIQTIYKRDERKVIIPGDWSVPEFAYLADLPWRWTEKVDGANIRLHFDGATLTIGGKTDSAQIPARLIKALESVGDLERWKAIFPDETEVTLYGEGYGAKIQSGGQYREDQSLIVFDVLVGRWWLKDEDVADVAGKLGLEVVPTLFPSLSLNCAANEVKAGSIQSRWPGARIEGLVGRPTIDLFNRRGERILAKIKVKDFQDYERRGLNK